jgi:hypothetical protein
MRALYVSSDRSNAWKQRVRFGNRKDLHFRVGVNARQSHE